MSQATPNKHDPDMLDEYDFSEGVRGKYAQRYHAGTNLIWLDDEVDPLVLVRGVLQHPSFGV